MSSSAAGWWSAAGLVVDIVGVFCLTRPVQFGLMLVYQLLKTRSTSIMGRARQGLLRQAQQSHRRYDNLRPDLTRGGLRAAYARWRIELMKATARVSSNVHQPSRDTAMLPYLSLIGSDGLLDPALVNRSFDSLEGVTNQDLFEVREVSERNMVNFGLAIVIVGFVLQLIGSILSTF